MKAAASLSLLLVLSLSSARASVPEVSFRFEPAGFVGDSTTMIVSVSVPGKWYIQSDAPLDEFLIPTSVRAEGIGLEFGEPVFPPHTVKAIEILGGNVALFQGDFEVRVPARRRDAKVPVSSLESANVMLRYQACDSSQCLPPREIRAVYSE